MRLGRFRRTRESGYILMVLLFFLFALLMATMATAPAIKTQIQRDREVEMIHRGAQYARAIKRYFKKFGRYPTSVEQLENTNHIRFLRKAYADPMTEDGKWRLLHPGEVKLGTGSTIGTPVSQMQSPTGALGPATTGPQATSPGRTGTTPTGAGPTTLGGGAIIGVASTSEKEGLHQFNDKSHYNEWYFIYDPTLDRGGLIVGPYTGKTFGNVGGIGTPAGSLGQPPTGFGRQPTGFGQPMQQPGGIVQPPPQPPQLPR